MTAILNLLKQFCALPTSIEILHASVQNFVRIDPSDLSLSPETYKLDLRGNPQPLMEAIRIRRDFVIPSSVDPSLPQKLRLDNLVFV